MSLLSRICVGSIAVISAMVAPSTALAGGGQPVFVGPFAYTSPADSPFFATQKVGVDYYLEDFERGVITVPGLSTTDINVLVVDPGANTDSVDIDDCLLDASGTAGHSLGNAATGVINLQFDDVELGGFPTQVGFVCTDGGVGGSLTITVVDPQGNPGFTNLSFPGDGSNTGGTGEDRFYGVTWANGIAQIQIAASPAFIEIDHVQFSAPAPALLWTRDHINNGPKSDMAWHRAATGAVNIWIMNGLTKGGGPASQTTPATYVQQGMGDFNGDGKADLFWRDSATNLFHVWLMSGQTVSTASPVVGAGALGPQWVCLGVGDTNGDGKADVVFKNSNTNALNIWYMDGVTRTSGGGVVDTSMNPMIATNLNFVALGDFNGDGRYDILWRDSVSNIIKGWLLNGREVIANCPVGNAGAINTDWVIGTVGDLDADGRADIVWRNTVTTVVNAWLMIGLYRNSGGPIGSIAAPWTLRASADMNGDGTNDLIWTNSGTGQVNGWLMDGLIKLQGGPITTLNNFGQWTLFNR